MGSLEQQHGALGASDVMLGLKQWLVDPETTDNIKTVEQLLSEPLQDALNSRPSYLDDTLTRAFDAAPRLSVTTARAASTPSSSTTSTSMSPQQTATFVPEEVFQDLEIFEPYRADVANNNNNNNNISATANGAVNRVFDAVDRSRLQGTRRYLAAMLKTPSCDVDVLHARQASLSKLSDAYAASSGKLDALLADMSRLERDALWMFRPHEQEMEALHDIAYFRTWFMTGFNRSSVSLTALNLYRMVASPLIGVLSPIVYFVMPYAILRLHYGVRLPFGTYVKFLWRSFRSGLMGAAGQGSQSWIRYVSCGFSLVFYFQSLLTSFEVSATLRKVCAIVVQRIDKVHRFFELGRELLQSLWSDDLVEPFFTRASWLPQEGAASSLSMLSAPPSGSGTFSMCSNFGANLKAFREFDAPGAAMSLRRIYIVDALLSVVRLRSSPGFNKVDVLPPKQYKAPLLCVKGGWHPCISHEVNIRNDFGLGGADPPGMMLTGPNAGGKSTLLKSMMIGVLLAQTLLTAPCSSMQLTPFAYLNSHVNVPDCKGRASLFEAEMNRAKANIDGLRALAADVESTALSRPERKHAFVIMDEIFSSTNPVEGIAGGYAVAKSIASTGVCLCAISTHFTYLCKLAKRTGLYSNWQMPVEGIADASDARSDDATKLNNKLNELDWNAGIRYPYKLRPGVCQQFIALELLKRTDFDADILRDAMAAKRDMLSPGSGPRPCPASQTKTKTKKKKRA